MKVRSIGNRGADLPPSALNRPGLTAASRYTVTPGYEYSVYAMSLSIYSLSFLVVSGENPKPYWIPVDLFEVTDHSVPAGWEFTVVNHHPLIRALWGYSSLINDPDHHDDLINREAKARDAFLRDNNLQSMADA
jgi:hypothetical protein